MNSSKIKLIIAITVIVTGVVLIIMNEFTNLFTIFDISENNISSSEDWNEAKLINPSDNLNEYTTPKENQTIKNITTNEDYETLDINPLVALSGKSKSDIYKLRKKIVSNSIFSNPNYQPSEEVFGNIESGKKWVNANPCIDSKTRLIGTNDVSEESRFIMNPAILVAIEYPFTYSNRTTEWCTNPNYQLIPRAIKYSRSKNEILVVYYSIPFQAPVGKSWFYNLKGLNARDLGYKYAYIDNSKSTYKPHFTDSINITNSIIEFKDFIHLGSSCGHSDGCNNGSPRQTYLEFQDDLPEYKNRNREIYIKLWKTRPTSPNSPADITERIIINWT